MPKPPIECLSKKAGRLLSEYKHFSRQFKEEKMSLEEARKHVEAVVRAQSIMQGLAQEVQQQAHKKISGVVTRCLQTVFDDPYDFQIVFEQKRGKTEARLVFIKDGLEIDPMTAAGGGVVDVAAFALRLSCLVLSKPKLRRVLILDEPFKFVSAEYRPRLRALLEKLSQEMQVQFLIVTHIPELRFGKVVDLD